MVEYSILLFQYWSFKALVNQEASVINCSTQLYNYKEPDEFRVDAYDNDIPFDWNKGEIKWKVLS